MRILLCDDHRLLVEAFASSLSAHGHEVVALTTTPEDALQAAVVHDPDVCVLDVSFPKGGGLEAVTKITSSTRCKVLMLSARHDADLVTAALSAGAAGFVTKDRTIDEFLHALERLSAGDIAVDRELLQTAIRAAAAPNTADLGPLRFLTYREREALRWIAEGQSTKEIARSMHVAYSTARTHVQNVLTKLGVRSRLQAAAIVARSGLAEKLDEPPARRNASPNVNRQISGNLGRLTQTTAGAVRGRRATR